jgi:Zn-dependent peptidase ImmA (M78 family)
MQASLDGVEFRKLASTPVKDRARVEAEVLSHIERYLAVEQILGLDSSEWNDPLGARRPVSSLDECEELAAHVRGEWRLGSDPIPNMTLLLEQHGIKVLLLDLPAKVDGLTCYVQRPGHPAVPCIVVNRARPVERRRFTLAHELAHRLIAPGEDVASEKAAQRFAGAFLMPPDSVRSEAGENRHALGYEEIIQLKRLYRVSAAAFLVRCEQLGIISHSALSYAFQTMGRTWRKQEPKPLEEGGHLFEEPKRFARLCTRALVEDLISLPKAAELLQARISDIEEAVKGPEPSHADYHQ